MYITVLSNSMAAFSVFILLTNLQSHCLGQHFNEVNPILKRQVTTSDLDLK